MPALGREKLLLRAQTQAPVLALCTAPAALDPAMEVSVLGSGVSTQHGLRCAGHRKPLAAQTASAVDEDAHLARYGGRLLGGVDGDLATGDLSQKLTLALTLSCLQVGLTALVFGYDCGTSGGSLLNLIEFGFQGPLTLSPWAEGCIMGSSWFGNVLGTMSCYHVSNSRNALLASGSLNAIGGIITCFAPNLPIFVLGRVLCGVGNGFSITALPQYTSEISPAAIRGGAIACQETTFIIGNLIGSVTARRWLKTKGGWRRMFGATCPLGLVAFAGVAMMPHTPRAIFRKALAVVQCGEVDVAEDPGGTGSGNAPMTSTTMRLTAAFRVARTEAEAVMVWLRGLEMPDEALLAEIDEIEQAYRNHGASNAIAQDDASLRVRGNFASTSSSGANDDGVGITSTGEWEEREEISLTQILASDVRLQLLISGGIAMIGPAFSGHPALMSYGTQLFKSIGYEAVSSANFVVALNALKLVTTLPDFVWLDSIGRRPLMTGGLLGISGCFLMAAVSTMIHCPRLAVGCLLLSSVFYQMSVAPLSWIIPSEVFPSDMRSRASALATVMYSGSVWFVVQLHPVLARYASPAVLLSVYGVSAGLCAAVSSILLPETLGRTLEEIEHHALAGGLFHSMEAPQEPPWQRRRFSFGTSAAGLREIHRPKALGRFSLVEAGPLRKASAPKAPTRFSIGDAGPVMTGGPPKAPTRFSMGTAGPVEVANLPEVQVQFPISTAGPVAIASPPKAPARFSMASAGPVEEASVPSEPAAIEEFATLSEIGPAEEVKAPSVLEAAEQADSAPAQGEPDSRVEPATSTDVEEPAESVLASAGPEDARSAPASAAEMVEGSPHEERKKHKQRRDCADEEEEEPSSEEDEEPGTLIPDWFTETVATAADAAAEVVTGIAEDDEW